MGLVNTVHVQSRIQKFIIVIFVLLFQTGTHSMNGSSQVITGIEFNCILQPVSLFLSFSLSLMLSFSFHLSFSLSHSHSLPLLSVYLLSPLSLHISSNSNIAAYWSTMREGKDGVEMTVSHQCLRWTSIVVEASWWMAHALWCRWSHKLALPHPSHLRLASMRSMSFMSARIRSLDCAQRTNDKALDVY